MVRLRRASALIPLAFSPLCSHYIFSLCFTKRKSASESISCLAASGHTWVCIVTSSGMKRMLYVCVGKCVFPCGYRVSLSAEGCDLACVKRRSEKRLKKTMRTLRKSINREQFHLHVGSSEYDLAKKPARPGDGPEPCSPGQVLRDRKCGEKTPIHAQCSVET